ncbi:hypothetical protein Rhe02_34060 [Rhizocola hellebori]|uniref:Integrase catalytic domain-containing protein n=1 Tax=Rhizocola hellebori TaxID=1392758 RepID=A0A8J3Q7E0_9ACTN|nr:hypothetical protein [Rhizocola hellebori]GIH05339.1 hypothetical protein Rhe02_34060 [Rhizocola hellebori]
MPVPTPSAGTWPPTTASPTARPLSWRYLRKAELVEPPPKKKPTSSYIRFQAALPNETWQTDFTHRRLADGTDTEILTFLDDHSRYALAVTAHRRVGAPAILILQRNGCFGV